MKRIASKIGIVVATVAMTVGLAAAPAEAGRDSGWGCPVCKAP